MSAGTGARDCKIDHLGGEDNRTHYPHQRNCGIIPIIFDLFRAISNQPGGSRPHSAANNRRYQGIGHVHFGVPPATVKYSVSRKSARKKATQAYYATALKPL
jgi:hypothetical protein